MNIVYYIFLFIALYFQVFFLYLYLRESDVYDEQKKDSFVCTSSLTVSLIVACWNEEDTVIDTIKSLLASDFAQEQLTIIVVDDGSTDATWDQMQAYKNHPQVILLQKENGGKFTAINYALEYVKTDLVGTVDADTFLEPDALARLVQDLEDDPHVSAIGATILVKKPKTWVQMAQMVEYQMFAFSKLALARINGALVVPGAFSVYRKEVFEKLGGFKEGHKLEDLELTFRMQEAGFKVQQSRNAIAYTTGPDSAIALFRQRLRWSYGFLMNAYCYRHMLDGKRNLNFGFFTLPMSVFMYLSIPIVFVSSWILVIQGFLERITRGMLLGWSEFFSAPPIGLSHMSFQAAFFISIIIYVIVFFMIFSGKKIAQASSRNPLPVIVFLILYAFLVPLWVFKSFYKILTRGSVAWR